MDLLCAISTFQKANPIMGCLDDWLLPSTSELRVNTIHEDLLACEKQSDVDVMICLSGELFENECDLEKEDKRLHVE
jgi:hypothetical protein